MADAKARSERKQNTDEDFRMRIHNAHKYVFMLVTVSTAALSSVTLLLEKVFHCENIANKCYFSLLVSGWAVITIALLWLRMSFGALVVYFWLLIPGLFILVVVIYFGNGNVARIIFISVYGINGGLEALILQASTFVISKLFLNSAISTLYSGYAFGLISMGVFQLIMEHVIGTNTISKVRFCAILCHGVKAAIAFLTALWITYLYLKYNWYVRRVEAEERVIEEEEKKNRTSEEELTKMQQLSKVIAIVPYYLPRLVVQGFGTTMRVFFYPYLVPFLVDLSNREKLVISLSYTLFDFVGTNYAGNFDETIDPSEKTPSQSHLSFVLSRDINLYILGFSSISVAGFVVWNIWTCKFRLAKSSLVLLCVTSLHGFIGGLLTGRGLNGSFSLIEYYNTQTRADGTKIIGDDIISLGNIINDVCFIYDYAIAFVISTLSNITERLIVNHKNSREYILSNNKGDLSIETVQALLTQFKVG
ncbi:hypothetical protein BEWA_026890 [Theileria equi strain WA]|uniref:Uncharacterized protein n=1 Tax=Theileria equi strain WA TaxID=1537102 RepID=L0AWB7_THEEQ|nr:hypothetical protein BEWA_026890 [Theileria equi strain WA]AFZ79840.1 hypothetical protein BEWA_026890 [Theileria equi strain WA]|eukprot:XP_004829506.1 hypothetical protein BEWA_026890 [Theileria equi strain WA]